MAHRVPVGRELRGSGMVSSTRRQLLLATAAFAASPMLPMPTLGGAKAYDEGASDTTIRIGNTSPYSGNASSYGIMGRTIEAMFRMVNDTGGINGRKVELVTYDDAYSASKTVEMVRKLVEQDRVLGIYHVLGTVPNTAIQRYLNGRQVPQIFVATGASKWGNPKEFPWTMGWQPSYAAEAAIYARHILETIKDPRIAVLMQNDDYGRDYLGGFLAGLGKDNEKLIVARATYEATDPTIDSQMIQLKGSGANVFFNITLPKFASQAIRKAAEIGWRPVHYLNNVSNSFASVLRPAGVEASQGIIVALYRKDVSDPQWAQHQDVSDFKAFMAKYMPNANAADDMHNYAFAVTHTMIEVLRRCGDELTRANLMKQAASFRDYVNPLLLPGIKINTSPTDFYPIQSMQLARVKGEGYELFGEIMSSDAR
jgi:branched-chain amino acid transport system substrate-binding protein